MGVSLRESHRDKEFVEISYDEWPWNAQMFSMSDTRYPRDIIEIENSKERYFAQKTAMIAVW